MTRWDPKVGEMISVWDRRLKRWREAEVMAVNLLQRLFTAKAGNVWFSDEVIHPAVVRPVRLVYCRRCSETRRAA